MKINQFHCLWILFLHLRCIPCIACCIIFTFTFPYLFVATFYSAVSVITSPSLQPHQNIICGKLAGSTSAITNLPHLPRIGNWSPVLHVKPLVLAHFDESIALTRAVFWLVHYSILEWNFGNNMRWTCKLCVPCHINIAVLCFYLLENVRVRKYEI